MGRQGLLPPPHKGPAGAAGRAFEKRRAPLAAALAQGLRRASLPLPAAGAPFAPPPRRARKGGRRKWRSTSAPSSPSTAWRTICRAACALWRNRPSLTAWRSSSSTTARPTAAAPSATSSPPATRGTCASSTRKTAASPRRATPGWKRPRATTISFSTATIFSREDACEILTKAAQESRADLVIFRELEVYDEEIRRLPSAHTPRRIVGNKAIFHALAGREQGMTEVVSDKLVRAALFEGLRFPWA